MLFRAKNHSLNAAFLLLTFPLILYLSLDGSYRQIFFTAPIAGFGVSLLIGLWCFLKQIVLPPPLVFLSIVGFLAVAFLKTIFSVHPYRSLFELVRLLSGFGLFFLSYNLIDSRKKAKKMIALLVVLGGVVGVFSLFRYLILDRKIGTRLNGPFEQPNQTAGFFLLVFPLSTALLLNHKAHLKLISSLSFVFILSSFLLTLSRAAYMVFLGQFFLTILFLREKLWAQRRIFVSLFILSIGLVFPLFPLEVFLERFRGVAAVIQDDLVDVSVFDRKEMVKSAVRMAKEHPFGVGLDGVFTIYHSYQTKPWIYTKYIHSSYLQILVTMGFLGLILFIAIFLGAILTFRKRILDLLKEDDDKPLAVPVFLGMLASAVHALVDLDWQVLPIFIVFLSLFSLLICMLEDFKKQTIRAHFPKMIFVILSFGLLALSCYLFLAEHLSRQARSQLLIGKYDPSIVLYQRAVGFLPFSDEYLMGLGEAYLAANRIDLAKEAFKRAHSWNNFNTQALLRLGQLSLKSGELVRGEENLKLAIEIAPFRNPAYYTALADFYHQTGNPTQEKEVFEEALARFPLNQAFFSYVFFYKEKRFKKEYFEFFKLYHRAGMFFYSLGEKEKARNIWREALKLETNTGRLLQLLNQG